MYAYVFGVGNDHKEFISIFQNCYYYTIVATAMLHFYMLLCCFFFCCYYIFYCYFQMLLTWWWHVFSISSMCKNLFIFHLLPTCSIKLYTFTYFHLHRYEKNHLLSNIATAAYKYYSNSINKLCLNHNWIL